MKQYERKVTKIGNSVGITLPNEVLKEAGVGHGDNIDIKVKDGDIVLTKKEHINLPDGVDAEFMNVLSDVIEKHDKAFKGLVNR